MIAPRPASWRRAAAIAVGLLLCAVAADMLFPPPLDRAAATSRLVTDREGRWLHAFTTSEGRWRFPAELDALDPVFVERVIAVEDKRFWKHWGVDPAAVLRAGFDAARTGRVSSGASTITMQTARLLEPRPRTLGSKVVEMFRALQIERRLSKREILELYLTLAPYGGNIEGARAASLLYFGKEPARLTDAEQALLIALPQAPEARRPDRRPDAARQARARMLKKLNEDGLIAANRAAEAAASALPAARRNLPGAAWHIARELAADADGPVVVSTLDKTIQEEAEAIARRHAEKLDDGATAALMIVDARTGAVRAAVGAANRDAPGGWMDLTRAIRSPGSTLKPFIYGLAFEDGLIGPNTVIDDMPQSFGGYAPENFDRAFHGEVRVADALQHSLNLPAVRVLSELGAGRLSAFLRGTGVKLRGPARAGDEFGLTLALGGAGATMREIAALYGGLAAGGAVRPLVWTVPEEEQAAKDAPSFRMFSAESAGRIGAILEGAPALEGRAPASLAHAAPRLAYKTGTSYGYRDAWAAGYSGRYVAVIWVGRADGAPRPGETGRKAAAPLLADLFDMLARFDPEGATGSSPSVMDGPAVARLSAPRRAAPPEIVFPRAGVELVASDGRGFSLAARGGAGGYRWYVDGAAVNPDPIGGRAVWTPSEPGFYAITVVDDAGRSARAKVRVLTSG